MVAFLRGLNVGKNHRVKNPELESIFTELELTDPTGYQASGNVVFDIEAANADRHDLETQIAAALGSQLGYEVPTIVRSGDEVRATAAAEPFDRDLSAEFTGKMQVAWLKDKPNAASKRALRGLATDNDLIAIDDLKLFWLPRGSVLDSMIEMADFDRIAGITTMRTVTTLQRIAKKFLIESDQG